MNILIRGDSVAAWCCFHLLRKAGFRPALERTTRSRLPAIMLGDAALSLIREVFAQPDLFRAAPRITKRVVQWGPKAAPVALEHSAIVVSEQELLTGLDRIVETTGGPVDFTIHTSHPLPPDSVEHSFGSRTATAAKARLKDERDSESCWIESLDDGWLFLIPDGLRSGWLLSLGGKPKASLDKSTLIAERIASRVDVVGEFAANPRIMSPFCGPAWLACGTAGMAFDPLCGDGTAHAIREAILASAVVRGIAAGGEASELLAHYQARLTLGFQRHLAVCCDFYTAAAGGAWWDRELQSLREGMKWCASRLAEHGEFRYRLADFELEKRWVGKPA